MVTIKYIVLRQLIARREVITHRGIVGFAATMTALVAGIERRGLTVFALVDHGGGAREAGLELENEQVILFGNPRTGTLLMQDDPRDQKRPPVRSRQYSTRSSQEETIDLRQLRTIYLATKYRQLMP